MNNQSLSLLLSFLFTKITQNCNVPQFQHQLTAGMLKQCQGVVYHVKWWILWQKQRVGTRKCYMTPRNVVKLAASCISGVRLFGKHSIAT